MKISILYFAFIWLLATTRVMAQTTEPEAGQQNVKYKNYIGKGEFAVGALYLRNPVSTVDNIKYEVKGVEINAVYYLLNRVGVEVNAAAFQYNNPEKETKLSPNLSPESRPLDQKKVIMAGPRIRYNFIDKYHCVTVFLQTGYSFGRFEAATVKNLHRWEMVTLGLTSSCLRQFIPNLDLDCRFSLTKDNLHNNLPMLSNAGLTYQFGNIRKQPGA